MFARHEASVAVELCHTKKIAGLYSTITPDVKIASRSLGASSSRVLAHVLCFPFCDEASAAVVLCHECRPLMAIFTHHDKVSSCSSDEFEIVVFANPR